MSANGTARAKGLETKSVKAAREAAAQSDMVEVAVGDGRTLVKKDSAAAKAAAERQRLIDAEKAKLTAESANSEAPVADGVPAEQKSTVRRKADKTPKAEPVAEGAPVVETTEQVIAREVAEGKLTPVGPAPKAPYNPAPLTGAPAAGKAPAKGQLPLGLLRMLVKRNPGSEKLKAALAAAEAGSPVKVAKGKKAKLTVVEGGKK